MEKEMSERVKDILFVIGLIGFFVAVLFWNAY
jgi:hypothetical protein